jgi:hypothetical protein
MIRVKLHERWMGSAGHTEVPVEEQKCLSCPLKGCN